jgi:hypothetical protein
MISSKAYLLAMIFLAIAKLPKILVTFVMKHITLFVEP